MAILVIAEHDEGVLKSGTLNTITAATQIGADVTVLVAGDGSAAVAATTLLANARADFLARVATTI